VTVMTGETRMTRVTGMTRMTGVTWITRMPNITGIYICQRFEPRSHLTRRLGMIAKVIEVLSRTVVDSD